MVEIGAVHAVCEAMGWDTGMGRTVDGFPQGGRIAADFIEELRDLGYDVVPLPKSDARDSGTGDETSRSTR